MQLSSWKNKCSRNPLNIFLSDIILALIFTGKKTIKIEKKIINLKTKISLYGILGVISR